MRGAISRLRDPATREFLLWCTPALFLGLILRVVLSAQMPFAFYHDDTPDFLLTADTWFNHDRFDLHVKKTFLVPILYTVPFHLGLPALIVIPIFQHLLGLGLIILVGLLCRLWFEKWRAFIVPLTVIMAVNPFLLWYEHTLMAETVFVFATVLLVLAATLYALKQSRARFVFLCAALFLEAGARPEGKLLFGFGLFLLALLHARGWRTDWPRFAIMLALALGTHFITRTGQAGLLLYTSVARLTPSELSSAPGIDPYVAQIRTELQRLWEVERAFPKASQRRKVADAVSRYLAAQPDYEGRRHRDVNRLCLRMALETCRRNLLALPAHVYHKFQTVSTVAPSERFDNYLLFDKMRRAFVEKSGRAMKLSRGLTGEALPDETALHHFIDSHYGEIPWFNLWQRRWLAAVNYFRFPGERLPDSDSPSEPRYRRGLPFYFAGAALGLIAIMFRRGRLRPFHIAWGISLLAFFFVIILTANVRARFRFVFEPFWWLYLALLCEMIWLAGIARWRARR